MFTSNDHFKNYTQDDFWLINNLKKKTRTETNSFIFLVNTLCGTIQQTRNSIIQLSLNKMVYYIVYSTSRMNKEQSITSRGKEKLDLASYESSFVTHKQVLWVLPQQNLLWSINFNQQIEKTSMFEGASYISVELFQHHPS